MLEHSRTSLTNEVKTRQSRQRQYEGFAKSNGRLKKLVTRSTPQCVLAYKFDNDQNNRFRNMIRGLTPKLGASWSSAESSSSMTWWRSSCPNTCWSSSDWKEQSPHRTARTSHTQTFSRVCLKLHSTQCFLCLLKKVIFIRTSHVTRAVIVA